MNAALAAVHVETVGSGPPLVLLHGFAMHGGLFTPIVDALARRRTVHVVDLPGHGFSAPPASYTLDAMVHAVDVALGAQGATIELLGWSLGGAVALRWAMLQPARVRRLALVATNAAFVARDDWPHAMARATLSHFGDELRIAYELTLKRFVALQVQGSEEGRHTLAELRARLFQRGRPAPDVLQRVLDMLMHIDLRSDVASIEAPALVVSGERDTLVPVAAGAWLARTLPHGRHVAMSGAGHAPFLSHPREFSDHVLGFLDAR